MGRRAPPLAPPVLRLRWLHRARQRQVVGAAGRVAGAAGATDAQPGVRRRPLPLWEVMGCHGVPQNRWFTREIPLKSIKMDDLMVYFMENPAKMI